MTLAQNARTSGGGNITMVPKMAITVGPKETWMAEKVSIWHAGLHDNPLGQRLTAQRVVPGLARRELVGAAADAQLLAGDDARGDHGDEGHHQQYGNQGHALLTLHEVGASGGVSLSGLGGCAAFCFGGLSGRRSTRVSRP